MSLFERIKTTAKSKGMSILELEKKVGMSENSLYTWKKSSPKSENLAKVADVLHVSVDYLMERTEDKNSLSSEKENDSNGLGSEIMMAFDGKDIPDEDKEKLLEFARFLKSQRGR